jgi:hypothetical protein
MLRHKVSVALTLVTLVLAMQGVVLTWVATQVSADGALRVGGRLDYGGSAINRPHDFDLTHATRAEVAIEKLLCHDGTHGLAFSVTGGRFGIIRSAHTGDSHRPVVSETLFQATIS